MVYEDVVEADPGEVFVVCEVGVVEPEADVEVVVPEAEAVAVEACKLKEENSCHVVLNLRTVLPAAAQTFLKASIAALVFSPQRLWI